LTPDDTRAPALLFVCSGNICRSPLAEGAMREEARIRGIEYVEIDSAALGSWHVGDPPDRRARATARRRGLDIDAQRARQVTTADFARFTHILALDHSHLAGLRRMAPRNATAEVMLLLDAVPHRAGEEVDDPYYGPDAGFETTLDDVSEAAAHLADRLWGPRPGQSPARRP
jgi:protein-tyrosine phosphatase